MKLYRCKTPTDRLCACGRVARSLKAAGIEVDVERVPLSSSPDKRENIIELTGQPKVPVLVEADGTATSGSAEIISRIESGAVRGTDETQR